MLGQLRKNLKFGVFQNGMNEEIKKEVKREIEEFNGLLDEETAYLLVMEKMGKLRRNKIKDLIGKVSSKVSLYAKIESFGKKERDFANAIIGDETGHCVLKLWEHNAHIANYLEEGDVIKIANGWCKEGAYGLEINVGKYGLIEKINKEIKTKKEFGIKKGIFCLRGILRKKYPTKVYIGEKEKFVAKILIDDYEIFLFDERVRDIQKFREGDEIAILWLYKNGSGKINATDFSRILEID